MDFVIAIKTEPNRVVRKNSTNNITLLISPVVKSADKTILHRDAAYLNKLEGTCFKCSKLSEIPPVEVCVVPDPYNPDPSSCLDQNPNNICGCFYCPDPPGPYSCFGGSLPTFITGNDTNRYPTTASVPGVGSGYWVGLQANNFYSNQSTGGWLVAVECETSEVVGAFPVSTPNFGYGSGSILGYSVMLYPAGIAYGAGLKPYARTSYPILAQNTADGDEIVNTTGFILTGPNQELGVPYQDNGSSTYDPSSSYAYFCNTGPAADAIDPLQPKVGIVTADSPNSCLQKYGSSTCPDFNSVPTQPNYDISDGPSGRYFLDIRKVSGINLSSIPTDAVFSFSNSTSDLGNYCSGVENIQQFSNFAYDAIFGVCSQIDPVWPDTPEKYYPNGCSDCVNETTSVPCQYVANLTMGSYQIDYGGYNAASGSSSSYNAIGPGSPPRIESLADSGTYTISNTNFWEKFWDWNSNDHFIELYSGIPDLDGYSETAALLPPIGSLIENCACSDTEFELYGVYLQESVKNVCGACEAAGPGELTATNVNASTVINVGRACVPECSNCPLPIDSTYPENFSQFGRVGNYGLSICSCKDDGDEGEPATTTSTVTQNVGSSIWWLNSIYGSIGQLGYEGITDTSPIEAPGTLQDPCKYGYPSSRDFFGTNPFTNEESCINIFNVNPNNGQVEFNSENFLNCTNYNDFNSPCFKSKFLPIGLQDTPLIIKPNITPNLSYNFNENVGYMSDDGSFISIKNHICPSGACPELDYLTGPMQSRPSIGQYATCKIPGLIKNTIECTDADGNVTEKETERVWFQDPLCTPDPDNPDKCTDPCACCAPEPSGNIGSGGGGFVGCGEGENCPDCCVGNGCAQNPNVTNCKN